MTLIAPKDKKTVVLNYIVALIIGILIGSNAFLAYQYVRLQKATDNLRSDIVTIIQAYNGLVTTLQQSGIVKQPQ